MLTCTLYSQRSGCAPNPFVKVDAMYLAFGNLDAVRVAFHQPSMAQKQMLCLFFRRVSCHPPRRSPGPPVMGVWPGPDAFPVACMPNWIGQSSGCHECLQINTRLRRPWLNTSSNYWPLDRHHYVEVITDYPPLSSGLLPSTTLSAGLRERRGYYLDFRANTHSHNHH